MCFSDSNGYLMILLSNADSFGKDIFFCTFAKVLMTA
jgi:hypothetical protein